MCHRTQICVITDIHVFRTYSKHLTDAEDDIGLRRKLCIQSRDGLPVRGAPCFPQSARDCEKGGCRLVIVVFFLYLTIPLWLHLAPAARAAARLLGTGFLGRRGHGGIGFSMPSHFKTTTSIKSASAKGYVTGLKYMSFPIYTYFAWMRNTSPITT